MKDKLIYSVLTIVFIVVTYCFLAYRKPPVIKYIHGVIPQTDNPH